MVCCRGSPAIHALITKAADLGTTITELVLRVRLAQFGTLVFCVVPALPPVWRPSRQGWAVAYMIGYQPSISIIPY